MAEFTLDTSGVVLPFHRYDLQWNAEPVGYRWPDLSPFAQGYVEALLRDAWDQGVVILDRWGDGEDDTDQNRPGFSDLSPEALALILRDCEAMRETPIGADPFLRDAPRSDIPLAHWLAQRGTLREAGAAFWAYRNGDKDAFLRANVITIVVLGKVEAAAKAFPPLTPYLSDDGKVCLR